MKIFQHIKYMLVINVLLVTSSVLAVSKQSEAPSKSRPLIIPETFARKIIAKDANKIFSSWIEIRDRLLFAPEEALNEKNSEIVEEALFSIARAAVQRKISSGQVLDKMIWSDMAYFLNRTLYLFNLSEGTNTFLLSPEQLKKENLLLPESITRKRAQFIADVFEPLMNEVMTGAVKVNYTAKKEAKEFQTNLEELTERLKK